MPRADGRAIKYAYEDHDAYVVEETPPIQNQWYTVFDEEDVRHLWCRVYQTNDGAAAKNIEVKWTIDGHVYFGSASVPNDSARWIYRNYLPSAGGTQGLSFNGNAFMAAYYTDKRGHSYKVEVRITSALGVNQLMYCECVIETLEET